MATTRYDALLAERDKIAADGEVIFKAAEAEGRELTDDERKTIDGYAARRKVLNGDIAREEERRAAAIEASMRDLAPRVTGGHDRAVDKPWGHELGVRIVEKNGAQALGGVKHAVDFALGDCMQAIFRAAQGGPVDPRFLAAASGGNTSDPSLGGFSVGTMLSMALFQMAVEASKLLPYCNVIEISEGSDRIEAPYILDASRATGSRFGGVRMYRRKEAATVTATQVGDEEKFELSLLDLMGLAYQTDRLMSDARMMGQVYGTAFRNEAGFVIDNEIVRGSGVGEMQGWLNSPALVTQNKETGQAADTVVMENLSNMWIRMPTRLKGSSLWFYNSEVGPQLDVLSIPAGTGALEPRFVSYGPDGILRIKGRPAIELEQASAVGDVGDISLVNLGEYIVIQKGALEEAISDHVRFLFGERAFRWTQRINGKSPWRTPVTPFKGSATQSPFIVLQAR